MSSKMTTNSQLSTTEPKKNKNELRKQLEKEQIHKNENHMEGYHWGGRGRRMGKRYRE